MGEALAVVIRKSAVVVVESEVVWVGDVTGGEASVGDWCVEEGGACDLDSHENVT